MNRLEKRLDALEAGGRKARAHPTLRRWLGIALTPAEEIEADAYVAPDFSKVDWSQYSQEVRDWLQVGGTGEMDRRWHDAA